MGNDPNISADKFPEQDALLGQKVEVCFHYDTSNTLHGLIVRSDRQAPYVTIIQLNNGRYILATECQYTKYTGR